MQILENICSLHPPIGHRFFINAATRRVTQSRRQIATGDEFHHQVKPRQYVVVKVIVDGGNRGVFQRR
jgi:hypothetical protein